MIRRQRLLDVDRNPTPQRSRCRDLVPLPREACIACGGEVRRESVGQPALFRHGGYGATRMTTFALCVDESCLAVRVVEVVEVRPDRRSA